MKVIRASEIGTYLYCKRAWWYQLQGYTSENKIELAGGRENHQQHGQTIAASNRLKILAIISLIFAILTAVNWLIRLLF